MIVGQKEAMMELLIFCLIIYFFPTFIALKNENYSRQDFIGFFFWNLLTAWSFFAWFLLLFVAVKGKTTLV
jgi:hypothetical protein